MATPKTASSSIDRALQEYNDSDIRRNHLTLLELDLNIENYFVFTFVRNPWSRLVSYYSQMKRPINLKDSNRKKLYDLANGSTFCNFLKKLNKFAGGKDVQNNFYLLNGTPIDFIGRFENLQEDFNVVCDKIGIPRQELPHKNKSKHKHYTEYYDEETKQIVAETYAKDIEYFGYEFGG